MTSQPDKSKLYHLAKCLTTLLVVIAHATRMHTSVGVIPAINQSEALDALTTYIYAFHMPLFYLLSGCVYGYGIERGKYTRTGPFLAGKLRKLGIPYLIFGVLYISPIMCVLGLAESYPAQVFRGILLGYDARHLWFLPSLFWIFVIHSLLRPLLVRGWKQLCLAGAISWVLFHVSGKFPLTFQILSGCYYQLFFFLGILFNRFYPAISKGFQKGRRMLFLLPLALVPVLFYNPGTLTLHTYNLIGILMMLFFCWLLLRHRPDILSTRFFTVLQKNAFGIYLFHAMIIYVLYALFGQYDIPPIVLSTAVIVCSTIMSVLASELLRKAKLPWILGE